MKDDKLERSVIQESKRNFLIAFPQNKIMISEFQTIV